MFMKRNVNVVGKSKGYISESLGIGGWLVFGVAAVIMMAVTMADAGVISFRDYGIFSPVQALKMTFNDNLLVRVGGVDMSVVDAGFGGGYWHLGLTNAVDDVVGWAKNYNKSEPAQIGRLIGEYSGSGEVYSGGKLVYDGLANGEKPVHAFLVYDKLDNGWGVTGGELGTVQDLLEGDMFFTEADILFDGVLGGVSNLPIYTSGTAYLPEMTVVIPEPATITLFTLGAFSLFRKRSI